MKTESFNISEDRFKFGIMDDLAFYLDSLILLGFIKMLSSINKGYE
jgi:hypothetical protein